MSQPKVLVSLLVGNASEAKNLIPAVGALSSLANSDLRSNADVHIVTLINGMGTGRYVARSEALLSQFGALLIEPRNLGIARGRNKILEAVRRWDEHPDYVLEIHNDMIFPERWFEILLEEMLVHDLAGKPRIGALGPGLISSGGFFGGPKLTLNLERDDPRDLQRVVTAAAGKAYEQHGRLVPRTRRGISHPLLTRWEALQEVGPYDEQFSPMNYEDDDMVRRLENAGWRVAVSLDSWVYHHYHLSRLAMNPGDSYRRNHQRFCQKYPDATEWIGEWQRDLEKMYRE